MARKPDTPCAGCGKLLYGGSTSKPAGERMCRQCRTNGPPTSAGQPAQPPSSGRAEQLEAIRAKLAAELAMAEGKDTAPIARALVEVMREIQAGAKPAEQPKKVGGVISLAAEAAKRRPPAAG